ncbi:MAG: hypothetical protein CML55_01245 [Rhodobacteraceae bacterium]|nr:hypothetical protein [Paracoccaceae bacterium]MBO28611.1 hypothetical protein [Paracoccaceae bacterium]
MTPLRLLLALSALPILAACGADGEPVRPTAQSLITLSSSGTYVSTNLGVTRGPLSLSLGLGL